ncbi:hypothetical protein evm_006989 [Chilo suppressalis]|nr:hypothetical protein evm_006989 [Chilo suppressalis]
MTGVQVLVFITQTSARTGIRSRDFSSWRHHETRRTNHSAMEVVKGLQMDKLQAHRLYHILLVFFLMLIIGVSGCRKKKLTGQKNEKQIDRPQIATNLRKDNTMHGLRRASLLLCLVVLWLAVVAACGSKRITCDSSNPPCRK